MRTLQKQILVNFMKILFCNKQLYRLKSFSSPAQTIKSLPNCTIKFNKNKLRNNPIRSTEAPPLPKLHGICPLCPSTVTLITQLG